MDIFERILKASELYDDNRVEPNRNIGGGNFTGEPIGDRTGFAKVVKKFKSGPGTGVSALDDPEKYKIVKKYLNKVKTQKNKRIFLDWSEQIKGKPNPWYVKLGKEVKLSRQPLNELINKVIEEEFPTAYSGREGRIEYAREMTVKSFINYWNQNGMFDGNEKLAKPLEQFVTTKKGANNYENINRYFREWKEGKFEVNGVDRKNLDKDLLQSIKKWSSSVKGKRSNLVKEQLTYLNKLSPNLSYDRVANLFAQKFPNSTQTLQHRLNQLTELKRNGVYNDGTGNPKKIPGIEIGERSGWLKEGYGKGFLGNYGRLVKKADELMAAGETKFARRLYNAADKFFSPTGIFTKAAGEGEHPLSRNMGDGPIGNQLKINSLVSGDLNQFKKFNFDSPVRNLVLEYENPNTTSARKKEIKLEIEDRKKLMNLLTEGPNQKGIVDSVKFNYGPKKIGASVDVPDIDKIKNFDINQFITRGEDYRSSVLEKGKQFGLIGKDKQITKQALPQKQIQNIILRLAGTVSDKCKVDFAQGGRVNYNTGSSDCLRIGREVVQNTVQGKGTPQQKALTKKLMVGGKNFLKSMLDPRELVRLRNYVGPQALGLMAAFEGGAIGYDNLVKGTPANESLANQFLLGIFAPYSQQAAEAKNLLESGKLSEEQRASAQSVIAFDNAVKKAENIEQMEQTQGVDIGGYGQIEGQTVNPLEIAKMKTSLENDLDKIDFNVFDTTTGKGMEYRSLADEKAATQMAKKAYSPLFGNLGTPLTNRLATGPRVRGPRTMQQDTDIDLSLPTYDRAFTPTDKQLTDFFRSEGDTRPLLPGEGTLIRMQQPDQVGLFGTQEKFAGGGIAGLSGGAKSGPAPESGPASDGLLKLFKRVRNY